MIAVGALFQIAVAVQAPDTVVARDAVPVLVRATVPGNTPPAIAPLRARNATLTLVGTEVRVGGGFGQAVATRETRYLLRAGDAGRAVIEPPIATLGRDTAVAPSHPLVVLDVASQRIPEVVARAPVAPGRLVDFHALVLPDTVWVGEQVTVQAGVFIDETGRTRLRRNPEYVPSTVDGAVAYDLPLRLRELPVRVEGDTRYRTFVFARALFPLRAGTLVVPPSRLGYGVGVGSALFGREETVTLVSERATVVVRTPPVAGRPADWDGAVGRFTIAGGLERRRGRVGDAIPYEVTIRGTGNIKLLPAPRLAVDGAQVTTAGDAVQVDTSALRVRGARTFRFMLVPSREGRLVVGPATYVHFDPSTARYERLQLPADTLVVAPGAVAVEDDAPTLPVLPLVRGTVWVPATPLVDATWFRALATALAVALVATWRRPRARSHAVAVAADVLPPPPLSSPADVPALRRRRLDEIAALAGVAPGDAIAPDVLRRRLRRAGATVDTADAVARFVAALDAAVFAPDAVAPRDDGAALVESLRRELLGAARPRRRWWRGARSAALVGVAALALRADAPDAAAVRAYRAGAYALAARDFAQALIASPRDAATWANLGAAHWMRGDTAGAVVAWQRSARLAPIGTPVRDWLAESGVSAGGLRATVPPVPVDLAAAVLLVIVAVGVTSVVVARARALPWMSPARAVVTVGAVSGAALVAFAWWGERAASLVVARRPVVLHLEPAVAGEVVSRAAAGDLAVTDAQRGAWRRIRLADGRAGWVPSADLVPLDAASAAAVAADEARVAAAPRAP